MLYKQEDLCSICNGLIAISNEKVEFHHNPSIIFLRKINLYQDESVIIDIWAQITLAHKNCNQNDGEILAKESKKEIAPKLYSSIL